VSSNGATRMPWRAKIFQSYFMFWAIFSTAGSSSIGFSSASARSRSIWPSARFAAPKRSPSPATWPSGM
jgi:hypothetical protein